MKNPKENVINLRKLEEPEFKIGHIEAGIPEEKGELVGELRGVKLNEAEASALEPYDKVKVKFDKFVNLIATHAYEEIFEKHASEDVIISTDLLTDLANAHEEKEGKRVPLLFVGGLVLGIILTWIILKM